MRKTRDYLSEVVDEAVAMASRESKVLTALAPYRIYAGIALVQRRLIEGMIERGAVELTPTERVMLTKIDNLVEQMRPVADRIDDFLKRP